MKKILVPTDFSKGSEEALKVAAQLANKFNITKINFGLEDRQKTINQLI